MSVYAMSKNAEPGADPKSYLVALKDYIPAEALAIYIFAVGFLSPGADAAKSDIALLTGVSLAVGLVAAAVIALATFRVDNLPGGGLLGISEKNRRRLVVIGIAWSALIAYVAATLQPFGITVATVDVQRFVALAAFLWAAILPYVASWLGVRGTEST